MDDLVGSGSSQGNSTRSASKGKAKAKHDEEDDDPASDIDLGTEQVATFDCPLIDKEIFALLRAMADVKARQLMDPSIVMEGFVFKDYGPRSYKHWNEDFYAHVRDTLRRDPGYTEDPHDIFNCYLHLLLIKLVTHQKRKVSEYIANKNTGKESDLKEMQTL